MRTALVTGGTRGIGAAISRGLKAQGHSVLATYARNANNAQSFAAETGISILQWDVADFASYAEKQKEAESLLGAPDIVIHNAGITRDATLRNMTPEMWHQVIDTNLSSAFYLCQWALPAMRAKKWGRVVLLSSLNGVAGQRGQTNYSAAKAGLLGFCKALAREVAHENITVNALAPGYTETDMVAAVPEAIQEKLKRVIPLGRFLSPDEVASAALYLVTKEAQGITGTTMHINGGHWMG